MAWRLAEGLASTLRRLQALDPRSKDIEAIEARIKTLRAKLAKVGRLEDKWIPETESDSPYNTVKAAVDTLNTGLSSVTMELSLGVKLQAPPP